ncbi:hypothetical protein VZT92_020921 [Zoarces viviparus]|uniref:G-protein coupled receptors family 1 profile domain-containing protein n=1 Tax=Zoarces viviparus TaxID=48416 RepID=A0AAW1EEX4_ZOAVI
MHNLTEFPGNATTYNSLSVIIKVCVVIPVFCIFLYCIAVMLHIFASHRQYLDSTRYILFAYMLTNDTLQLLSSVLLFLFVMGHVKMSIAYCVPLLFLSTATFQNTPLILATMCLERYVAIFYPLQRLALRPYLVVAVVIIFTYVRILLETRKLRQDKVSVSKAMHTVLLHGFQLLLCILAFTHPITETFLLLHVNWLFEDISFFNYFCFILTPRFLSPLIYGFRDQNLRGSIRKTILCCSNKVKPGERGKLQDDLSAS